MTYADCPFTLDATAPIGAEAQPSIGYDGSEAADLKAYADEFYGAAAGPLTLSVTPAGTGLGTAVQATIGGSQDRVAIDWGDGTADVADTGDGTFDHDYRLYGVFFVGAGATVDGVDYVTGAEVAVEDPTLNPQE